MSRDGRYYGVGHNELRADCNHGPRAASRTCVTRCLLKLWKMRRLRISAISYLNTAPLMWDFGHEGTHPFDKLRAGSFAKDAEGWATQFDISYTLPSGCARALAEGTLLMGRNDKGLGRLGNSIGRVQ